jgi:flagellin
LTFGVGPAGDITDYTVVVADNASAADIASSITASVANVSASAQTIFRLSNDSSAALAASDTVDLEVNGVALTGIDASSIANFMAAFETAVESTSSLSALTVNVSGSGDSTVAEVIDASGNDVTFGITSINDAANGTAMDFILSVDAYTDTVASGTGAAITSTGSGTVDPGASAATGATAKDVFVTVSGTTSLFAQDSTLQYTIQSSVDISSTGGIGENSAAQTGTVSSLNLQVDDVDVSTVAGAEQGMQIIDAAIAEINSQRATLGAVQSRFDSVVSNLMNVSENSSAARSRIMDADFAAETAQLAKTQILQQAGISVLAQANAQPQNVLALLQ